MTRQQGLKPPGLHTPSHIGANDGEASPSSSQGDELRDPPVAEARTDHRARARTLFNQRRDRIRWFGEHAKLFQDSTWGILLELFLCGEEGHAPSTTSIGYGTAVPITTTLRALNKLELNGLVESWTDALDARVRRARLTPEATFMMRRYLDNV